MRRLAPLLPAAALLATGCASLSGGAPPDDLAEMKARILELQRKVTVAEVEIDSLRRQVAELQARPTASAEPVRPPAASTPRSEPRDPRPPAIESVETDDLEPRRVDLPARDPVPAPGSAGSGTAPAESPGAVPPPAAAPSSGSGGESAAAPISATAQALYDRGYTLFHQGRYVDAESAFQRFLQSHGTSDLADNALYWIGEARLARSDTQGALAAFREVASRYPEGNKVADALLKTGDCLADLGDAEGARRSYDELVRRFPATAAAAMAEERRRKLP